MSRTPLRIGAAVVAAAAAAVAFTPPVLAGPNACDTRVNNTHAKLLECITLDGVMEHQQALQDIADANNGTRVSGSPGYDESVEYVVERLEKAGYTPEVQEFTFQTFISLSPPVLERVSPPPAGSVSTSILSYSGSGDVTAAVTALPAPPADATPGCEASDFATFSAGNIALISRGSCTFAIKATNAYNAGASAVIIYNNAPGVINGTLGNDFTLDIPVLAVTQADGAALASTAGLTMRVQTDTFRGQATTSNVIAQTSGNTDNVVVAGAHLDSVNAGPGINDNGSGSSSLLEVAEQMAKVKPVNAVRFAWWGAEEASLVGSTYYVNSLTAEEKEQIALYLNFDMVGSPNYVFFVYDGDDSDAIGAGPGPAGSAEIEKTFEAFYSQRGIPFKGTDFSGRSDYGPFIAAGIPSGGLFTGAEGIKTAEEESIWGGTAGIAYDPCYHQACDDIDNLSSKALDVNSDAIGFAVLQYAMSTVDVNGKPGKGNFPPAQPTDKPRPSTSLQSGHADGHELEVE
ncbi:M28 family metallopeptidase [Fodinibacter luteus]|uniref:M28 family metallopeptidase n=1 Tax=Fodinibacter luteus TaxID=552064 RepID=A0ABP8JWN9_9MICO